MTITIDLPKGIEAKAKRKAKDRGLDFDVYLERLVEQDVLPSWNELVRPIHEETKRLGLTEKEIEELVDSEIAAVRRETPLWTR